MQVDDNFFSGRIGWAEQLLFSIQVIERGNREFRHPNLVRSEVVGNSVTWDFSDDEIRIKADLYTVSQLLVNQPDFTKRVRAYTPTRAIDVGVDRDLQTKFTGIPVQSTLMADKNIITLEERTGYLLQAKIIYDALVKEWNDFADLQENLWAWIYHAEGLLEFSRDFSKPGANYHFSLLVGFPGTGDYLGYQGEYPAIRDVDRANYEAKITGWLLDAGITARSNGVAVSNDTYILWLAEQLTSISASAANVAKKSIDPRYIYRFNPALRLTPVIVGADNEGSTGVLDQGNTDPAINDNPGGDLLEELADREQPLSAELGGGLSTAPINTLPEC